MIKGLSLFKLAKSGWSTAACVLTIKFLLQQFCLHTLLPCSPNIHRENEIWIIQFIKLQADLLANRTLDIMMFVIMWQEVSPQLYFSPGLFFCNFFSFLLIFGGLGFGVLRLGSYFGFLGLGLSVDGVWGLWCGAFWVLRVWAQ